MKKKLVITVLPLLLSFGLLGSTVSAQTYTQQQTTIVVTDEVTGYAKEVQVLNAEGGYNFYIEGGKAIICGYTGKASTLRLPVSVQYGSTHIDVAGLGMGAFRNNTIITAINIPSAYKVIGDYAFWGCTSLKSVMINEGTEEIGAMAFKGCKSLASVVIPPTVINIGDAAFQGCSGLTAINVKTKFTGTNMFEGCTALTTVTLADTMELIDDNTFANCIRLSKIKFPASLKIIGDGAFKECASLTSVSFGPSVKAIGAEAFSGCKGITALSVPKSIEAMGEFAFAYCENLKNVALEEGLTVIGGAAFACDELLTTIYIPSSVTKVGAGAFTGSGVDKGIVYCTKGSAADQVSLYPAGTKLVYSKPVIAAPKFAVKGYIGGKTITLTSAASDAVIYYSTTTSEITTSDKSVKNGGSINFKAFNGTVYAKAYLNGQWSDVSKFVLKVNKVNTPVITQKGNVVTITCDTPDALLYYTTDGSVPSLTNGTYIEKNTVTFNLTYGVVKAIAVRDCYADSNVATFSFAPTVNSAIPCPSFQVKGIMGGRKVTFNSTVPGAKVYYSATSSTMTLDDKNVAAGGSVDFNSFYGTIYARTYINGQWSNPARLILRIPTVNTPIITRSYTAGQFNGKINITTTTPDCTLIYTTDGTKPSLTNGRQIKASNTTVYVGTGSTVKVMAVRSCFSNSEIVTFN